MQLETFAEVLEAIRRHSDRPFSLLLGNGFSMAYDRNIFSYTSLYDFVRCLDDDLLSKLFEAVKTKDFEVIMRQLETLGALLDAFDCDDALRSRVTNASDRLKQSLVDAIRALHPEHVFTVPEEKSAACARFLGAFLDGKGHVFTTNYDLLLYWVLMRNQELGSVDGFGRELENAEDGYIPEDELEFSELRWGKYSDSQMVHYLHGALPLFDTGVAIVKEQYETGKYLLQNINDRISKGEYPIFVTAGDGRDKLTHIMHNHYLSYCYDRLIHLTGSLVTFGFNFGQSDDHIIGAINKAAKHGRKVFPKLLSLYIGVYSTNDQDHIESIADRFKCKVHIYDAKTADVWGNMEET